MFRMYDPVLGRFAQIDPIDKEDLSTYAWVTNNPLLYADPYGLDSVRYDDLPNTDFDPDNDVVVLDEVEVEATYTGKKAEDSPAVQRASQVKTIDEIIYGERASGSVEPFYFVPNPVEAAISTADNLRRGELLTAGIAALALAPGGKTIRGVIKHAGLPVTGKIRFIPRKGWTPSQPLLKGPKGGYLDRFGNEWTKKKVAGKAAGEIHWDVQLSQKGKASMPDLTKGRNHLNVTKTGKIAH